MDHMITLSNQRACWRCAHLRRWRGFHDPQQCLLAGRSDGVICRTGRDRIGSNRPRGRTAQPWPWRLGSAHDRGRCLIRPRADRLPPRCAVELRQGVGERGCGRAGRQRGGDVLGKIGALRTFDQVVEASQLLILAVGVTMASSTSSSSSASLSSTTATSVVGSIAVRAVGSQIVEPAVPPPVSCERPGGRGKMMLRVASATVVKVERHGLFREAVYSAVSSPTRAGAMMSTVGKYVRYRRTSRVSSR